MFTRRDILRSAGASACMATTGMLSAPWAKGLDRKSDNRVVVYDGEYPGWPWITKGEDRRLYCVFREGTRHEFSPQGRILLSVSGDGGSTWSPATTVVDESSVDDRNVAIMQLANGNLLLTYNTYTESKESQAMACISKNSGGSFSPAKPLDMTNTRTKSAALQLKSGTLVLPYYVAPGNGSLAAVSENSGETWRTYPVPDVEGFIGDEWDILEVEPGKLVGIIRNSHPTFDGFFWITESHDEGKTWKNPRKSNLQSQRYPSPAQICMHHDRPMVLYSDRRMVSVSAARSNDPEFLHWDLDHKVTCYEYEPDGKPIDDGSYPVSVELDDNARFIVDYEIRHDSKRITGYYVKFPENW